ncbi:putative amidophosphoribosyltransferase [Flavimobilis soli]|uniref:Putative amidophosphoribosyltransferase n=1 Tax=Flavimobilis soli TaxID=442709 RepID=A0A2A9EHB5_9MICO|nr:hypothetical protein [Flavimobilis soli]PFG37632.1 putative amidophosphoribosyltransferase [Flavimobilis soli]
MLREVVRLVLPLECAGCGRPDVVLCGPCSELLCGAPRRVDADAPRLDVAGRDDRLPVWALADYRGPVREAVVAWKDRGRADLDPVLVAGLRSAARTVAPSVQRAVGPTTHVLVVPVPSSPLASLRRGRAPVGVLASAVVDGFRGVGLRASLCPALVGRASARDQVGLGQRARQRNVSGRVALRRSAPARTARGAGAVLGSARGRSGRAGVPGCAIVLVDDVLTTGATLATAAAALGQVRIPTLAALVLAATPAPRGTLVLPPGPGAG